MATKSPPQQIVEQIYEHGKNGREALKRGAIDEAELHFLNTWNLIPEPKLEHDYAQSLSGGLVSFYKDTRQFEKAKKWLEIMKQAYGPEPNDHVEFVSGTVHFEANELDDAFQSFDKLYKKYKQRPFQGYDKKYLDFYKKRASGK